MSRFYPRTVGAVCAAGLAALVAALPVTASEGSTKPTPSNPTLTTFTILSGMTLRSQ